AKYVRTKVSEYSQNKLGEKQTPELIGTSNGDLPVLILKKESTALEALQGVWTIVSQEEDGVKMPADDLKYMALIIRGDKFTYTDGNHIITGTFKLVDSTASPKTLDSIPEGGPFKGKRIPGIYELKDGKLQLCLGVPGKKRPTEFSA